MLAEAAGRVCFTCSFQAKDVAVLHLLRQVEPDIPVLFLDTGYHFPDLIRYRDRLVESWALNLVNLTGPRSREQQEEQFGQLYRTDPASCHRMRKLEPLFRALENYSVWSPDGIGSGKTLPSNPPPRWSSNHLRRILLAERSNPFQSHWSNQWLTIFS